LLLDATEKLILAEGYAAVTTRRVAKEVGLTPALIHYYFPKTDDLLVAVFQRATDQTIVRLTQALAADDLFRALWNFASDPGLTALALEFMALANHRKVIRAEIARSAERVRKLQADALAKLPRDGVLGMCSPTGWAVLLAAISRVLVMEQTLGISSGHADARAFVDSLIGRLGQEREAVPVPATNGRRA
jgi:AcrR family transcriptional regulator